MRPRIIAAFPSLTDARVALGMIKKADLKADLTVLYALNADCERENRIKEDYELGEELIPLTTEITPQPVWSGLNEENVAKLGRVQMGTNRAFRPLKKGIRTPAQYGLTTSDLHLIQGELRQNKVIGVAEIAPETLARVRMILESNGAEILEDQA